MAISSGGPPGPPQHEPPKGAVLVARGAAPALRAFHLPRTFDVEPSEGSSS